MSGAQADAARVRARLLSRINHELRAPLARIAALAAGGNGGDVLQALHAVEGIAHRQLEWLSNLQECARCEFQLPELTLAPAYLHSLLKQCGQEQGDAGHALPALALVDARMLTQVLDLLARLAAPGAPEPSGKRIRLQAERAGGMAVLRFSTGDGEGPWSEVQGRLDDEHAAPGQLLAMHLVRAMGGCLQQSPSGLRFEIRVAPADEADALPPAPRFVLPPPFGQGRSVLLLEPHAPMRDYVADILESAAFDVRYVAAGLDLHPPALVLCADASVRDVLPRDASGAAPAVPLLLHAMLPPARPADFAAVLYKPATPETLLKTVRGLLSLASVHR